MCPSCMHLQTLCMKIDVSPPSDTVLSQRAAGEAAMNR